MHFWGEGTTLKREGATKTYFYNIVKYQLFQDINWVFLLFDFLPEFRPMDRKQLWDVPDELNSAKYFEAQLDSKTRDFFLHHAVLKYLYCLGLSTISPIFRMFYGLWILPLLLFRRVTVPSSVFIEVWDCFFSFSCRVTLWIPISKLKFE